MIAPNKQNLLLLKGQKKTFQNGHKLLKEKRNGLIVSFLELSRRGRDLEKKLSKDLQSFLSVYEKSLTFVSAESLLENIDKTPALGLEVKKKRLSGVSVRDLSITIKPPKRTNLRKDLNVSLNQAAKIFPLLMELIQLKLNCEKMAHEILKTNRQISNIEKKIEEFGEQVKWIQSTLQEKDNLEKSTLIKIFN